ncbi:hypothetical protein HNV11_02410 [Spirosoma taeanense]|uniref:Glycosyl transferase n=1 Tax=Spirosoma taeanense TaxID=2735870 RepID=A0A6M5Y4H9_9BACT|nr:hypothetical protein [Spirosoma taeanense]QJW88306.1 hypothetical protein HNV11_02410 [Spirosoma taeanense]
MRKAVFSIVAKNYIPMANALGDSIKAQHPDVPFYIVVADQEDGVIRFDEQRYPVVQASQLGIDRAGSGQLAEMAFKYNVTEFCTALKPFAFDFFFEQGFEQVIYFDPDIYVFASLDAIFDRLNQASVVVTPHVCTMQSQYTGLVPEGMLMHVGIFNFGFCAIASSANGRRVVEWWKIRLKDQCYADKIDGLHTDQKWMDFLPSLIEDLHIERGLGYNLAIWNWHERRIEAHNDAFWVVNRLDGTGLMPLVFFHYSNFLFSQAADRDKFRPKYIQKFPDVYAAGDYYANQLAREAIGEYSRLYTYTYATFDNGTPISHFHRRLFRRLLESGYLFAEPFRTGTAGSFYDLLKKNNLVSKPGQQAGGKQNEENFAGFEQKLAYIQRIARLIKGVIGMDRYALLCKFAQRFVRPENQTFLINEVGNRIPFYNENRYINWEVSSEQPTHQPSLERTAND